MFNADIDEMIYYELTNYPTNIYCKTCTKHYSKCYSCPYNRRPGDELPGFSALLDPDRTCYGFKL